MNVQIYIVNFFVLYIFIGLGYIPFIIKIVGYNLDTVTAKSSGRENCTVLCNVSFPPSVTKTFESFSLDVSKALFVHFQGSDFPLKPSNYSDILDSFNLVWLQDIDAPFLSLDLGFRVYSLTMLSRKVDHMTVMVATHSCLNTTSYGCITASLANSFLSGVTKRKGALCYVVNDTTKEIGVIYRCCKENTETQQIECGVPAVFSRSTARIFITVCVLAAIGLLCFPVIFPSFPDEENSETLSYNTQVRLNPVYRGANCFVLFLRRKSRQNIFVYNLRWLIVSLLFLPALYYVHLGLAFYTANHDIPSMFNDAVKDRWLKASLEDTSILVENSLVSFIIFYVVPIFGICVSRTIFSYLLQYFELEEPVNDFEEERIDWKGQKGFIIDKCKMLKGFLQSKRPLCEVILICLSLPVVAVFAVCTVLGYVLYISPLGRVMSPLLYYIMSCLIVVFKSRHVCAVRVPAIFAAILWSVIPFFTLSLGTIISQSLLLISRFVVYICMGIVACRDDYLPLIALCLVFVYYIWDRYNSASNAYQTLLNQTYEKCKRFHESEEHPFTLLFTKEGTPRIPKKLFQKVIDGILPLGNTYAKLLLKITVTILFLTLTYESILVYSHAVRLSDIAKTIAVFLSGAIPKLVEILGDYKSKQLIEIDNEYKVEKILREFLSSEEESYVGSNDGPGDPTEIMPLIQRNSIPSTSHS